MSMVNKKLAIILGICIIIVLIIAFGITNKTPSKSKIKGFGNVVASSIDGMIVTKKGNTLNLSLDNGKTFTKSLDIKEVGLIKQIFLFEDGELLIGNHTKLYYSYDWVRLTESSVVGIDGEPFVPTPYENFSTYMRDVNRQIVDGKEMLVWGNYSIQNETQYENINVWYTTDKGKTVKSGFKYGDSVPFNNDDLPLECRHVHDVNFNPNDNTFWVQSGDEDTKENSHWLKGIYDRENDTWDWERVISGDYAKTASMVFRGDEVYWAWDVEGGGVMKSKYEDLGDPSKYTHLLVTENEATVVLVGERGDILATVWSGPSNIATNLYYAPDGVNFVKIKGEIPPGYDKKEAFYLGFWGVNNEGKILSGILSNQDDLKNWQFTPSIWLDEVLKDNGYPNAFKPL